MTTVWIVCLLSLILVTGSLQDGINGVHFRLDPTNGGNQMTISVLRFNEIVQQIQLGEQFGNGTMNTITKSNGFTITGNGKTVNVTVLSDTQALALIRVQRTAAQTETRTDCVRLQSDQMSWYGGPQQRFQYWPIDKLHYDAAANNNAGYAYVTKEADSCAIAERYWLNSRGSFIYVDAAVPLFVHQNAHNNSMCLVARRALPYDTHTTGTFEFSYYIGVSTDARAAHMQAVARFLGKPTGHPADRMVRYPVWSTWARYLRNIDAQVVLDFANAINANQFANSQFEIDDDWETCYGSLTFNTTKFPAIKTTTADLKALGFKVTLWIHPFINVDCEPTYSEALAKGYLVQNHTGSVLTQWWNSQFNKASYVDFTKTAAANWFYDRLAALLESSGVDSYKFDAGESSWTPPDPILNGSSKLVPGLITERYVQTVSRFGDLVEVRSGLRTQHLPIFMRMIDKDTRWSWENGLPTLITTLLQLNIAGYPLVLPDMIGGNGYDNNPPSKELFVRWLQANVFMPSLQYSFVPWDFDADAVSICRKYTELHATYADLIMERFALAVSTGEPVNPPLWWSSPNDKTAQRIYDQFMLGDTVIAAPVIEEGKTTRNVYLTAGQWRDGTTGTIYVGPRWLMDYNATLEILPYFIRV